MRITKDANYRLAASVSVFERGTGVAKHTPLIAERRAAIAREAYVFDRGSGSLEAYISKSGTQHSTA